MASSTAAASTQATHGSASSQSSLLPQKLTGDFNDNSGLSNLAKFVNNNHQTAAGTSREALRRYFSSPDRPIVMHNHNSVEASVAAHEVKAQASIDAVDAAMEQQDG